MKVLTIALVFVMVVMPVFSGGGREAPTPAADPQVELSPFEDVYPQFAASNANIDWRQFAGETIHVAMLTSVLMDWQVEMIPDFERLTGIRVEVDGYAENALWQKTVLDLSSGTAEYDLMFVGPFFAPRFVQENWVADLSVFLNDPTLTDQAWYDYEDILGSIRGAYTVGDYISAIPLDGVTHALFYRRDLFDQYEVAVPRTMDELTDAARRMTMDTNNDGRIDLYGIGLRGVYNQIMLPGFIFTYGGGYVDENFRSLVNSPATRRGVEKYTSLVTEYGPPGSAAKNWPDVLEDFRQGNTAMIVDTVAWAPQFEDPERSSIVGNVGIAPVPGIEPGSIGEHGWWSWSMAINDASRNKGAAWLYLQWATSKLQSLRFSLNRGVTSRNWVTTEPHYLEKVGGLNFGDWIDVYLQGMNTARPDYLTTQVAGQAIPEATEITQIVGTEVTSILAGQKSLDEALRAADRQVDQVLREAGY